MRLSTAHGYRFTKTRSMTLFGSRLPGGQPFLAPKNQRKQERHGLNKLRASVGLKETNLTATVR
jgi:hypothetical protein